MRRGSMIRALRRVAKAHPVWVITFTVLGACGIAWAAVKLVLAAGAGAILALLRDAGHQVGGGGLPGALGSGMMGGSSASGRAVRGERGSPPLESDYKPPPRPLTDDERRAIDDFLKTPVRKRWGKSDWGKKGSYTADPPAQGWFPEWRK
jgi:hypothetical protein